jgi:hypothetical protein
MAARHEPINRLATPPIRQGSGVTLSLKSITLSGLQLMGAQRASIRLICALNAAWRLAASGAQNMLSVALMR